MNRVVIGFGSNIDPWKNVQTARDRVSKEHKVLAVSQFRETLPVDAEGQPNFVNGVMLIETEWERQRLKGWLREIERQLGREPEDRKGPRTIDLDLIIWNDQIVDEDVRERAFLRESVKEILPQFRLDQS